MRGNATGVRLDRADALFLREDGHPEKPLLTRQGIQLSAEMVSSTYSLAFDDWQNAEWQDLHIEIDWMMTGAIQRDDDGVADFREHLQLKMAKDLLKKKGPLRTLTGVLRQTGEVDTCKAVVLAKVVDGRAVIAISFMGTSKRLFDWVSNLRMRAENGMHRGFRQLARRFAKYEKGITFPETAKALGVEELTLSDILEACKKPDAPYMLWIVGHSQGSAIAQIYMDMKMREGVDRSHIAAFGFASPSVLAGSQRPGDYPMVHILNSDDVVPRMGAIWHLGDILIYPANAEFRRACYEWPMDRESVEARQLVRAITSQMTDTGHDIMVGMAYCRLLAEEPVEILTEGLRSMGHTLPAIPDAVSEGVENSLERAVDRLMDRSAEAYESIYGKELDLTEVIALMQQIRKITDRIGMMRYARAFGELCMEPHRAQIQEHKKDIAYLYIARQGYQSLHRAGERNR